MIIHIYYVMELMSFSESERWSAAYHYSKSGGVFGWTKIQECDDFDLANDFIDRHAKRSLHDGVICVYAGDEETAKEKMRQLKGCLNGS